MKEKPVDSMILPSVLARRARARVNEKKLREKYNMEKRCTECGGRRAESRSQCTECIGRKRLTKQRRKDSKDSLALLSSIGPIGTVVPASSSWYVCFDFIKKIS